MNFLTNLSLVTMATAMILYNVADGDQNLISGPHQNRSLEENLPNSLYKCLNDTEGRNTSVVLQEGTYRVYISGDDAGDYTDKVMDCMEDIGLEQGHDYSFGFTKELVYWGYGEDHAREMLSEEKINSIIEDNNNLPPFRRYAIPAVNSLYEMTFAVALCLIICGICYGLHPYSTQSGRSSETSGPTVKHFMLLTPKWSPLSSI